MGEQKKTTEELLQRMSENNKKAEIAKLESDENGVLLLDPSNPYHREWLEKDDDYEIIEHKE